MVNSNASSRNCQLGYEVNMQQVSKKSDRYVSFKGIECEKNCASLMAMLRRHIDDPEKNNPFWDKFRQLLAAADDGTGQDYLFLIHSYINNIQELFDLYEDQEALALLRKIEVECC